MFKALTSDQKDELSAWRSTPSGQKSMKEAKDKFKAQAAAKKAKKEEGESTGGGDNKAKEQRITRNCRRNSRCRLQRLQRK